MSKLTVDEIRTLNVYDGKKGYVVMCEGEPICISMPDDEDVKLWQEDEDHHEGMPSFIFTEDRYHVCQYFDDFDAKKFTVMKTQKVDWRKSQVEIT